MAKLFVFGIGGTGVRVLKSLVMLLASGVKINATEVIPIIIDVDQGGGDLKRTVDILNYYKKIHKCIARNNYQGFFQTTITDMYEIAGREFRLTLTDVQDKEFTDYLDYISLNDKNKRFANMLFSEENLNLNMNIGFKGKPNLGSIVLNQFVSNPDFLTFAKRFERDDRIFIISSIHGGTGSAGFPLLLKNIRNANQSQPPVPNSNDLINSLIGGITVLPYFKLNPGEIKSEDFISKAIAALEYYKQNLNNSIDALYYIGCNDSIVYENNPGGPEQKNAAHFVELASTLAVLHFADHGRDFFSNQNNKFLEYGVRDYQNNIIDFSSLGDDSRKILFKPLGKYYLFLLYLSEQLKNTINKQPWSNRGRRNLKISDSFVTSDFYKTLDLFNAEYLMWLREFFDNKPAFRPFNIKTEDKKNLSCINNIEPKNINNWKNNFTLFDDSLNKYERKYGGKEFTQPQKFIGIFNDACSRVLNLKYQE